MLRLGLSFPTAALTLPYLLAWAGWIRSQLWGRPQAVSLYALQRLRDRMAANAHGRQILAERPIVSEEHLDMPYLDRWPECSTSSGNDSS